MISVSVRTLICKNFELWTAMAMIHIRNFVISWMTCKIIILIVNTWLNFRHFMTTCSSNSYEVFYQVLMVCRSMLRNFKSRGNHYVKGMNFRRWMIILNRIKMVRMQLAADKKPETGAESAKPTASQIQRFYCRMLNHRRSECFKLQSKQNNGAWVELKGERKRDNQFVIPLYANDQLVDGYRDSDADISLACRRIVRLTIISQIKVSTFKAFRGLTKFRWLIGLNLMSTMLYRSPAH